MPTARIVEAVDIFESGNFDLSSCLPVSAPDHFGFEGFEKALDNCPRHWFKPNGEQEKDWLPRSAG